MKASYSVKKVATKYAGVDSYVATIEGSEFIFNVSQVMRRTLITRPVGLTDELFETICITIKQMVELFEDEIFVAMPVEQEVAELIAESEFANFVQENFDSISMISDALSFEVVNEKLAISNKLNRTTSPTLKAIILFARYREMNGEFPEDVKELFESHL